MANNVVDILKGVVGELKEVARTETVIGEPVTVGDRTVIPVVKISFGFGAGGGQKEGDKTGEFGGGGGGGAKIEPTAFIIMDEDGVRILPAAKGKWEGVNGWTIATSEDTKRKMPSLDLFFIQFEY